MTRDCQDLSCHPQSNSLDHVEIPLKDKNKSVELMPQEWESGRPKKREPLFGTGALPLIGELLVAAFVLSLFIGVILLATHLRTMLFGEPQSHQAVPPGNYTWTPDHGLVEQPSKEAIETEMKRRGLLKN
jgi:hypothetical protein